MNRSQLNQFVGTLIGKTLGYAVQGLVYSEISKAINSNAPSIFLIKTGTNCGIRLIKYTCENYVRTDFKSEKIFSDAIDASFFAD